MLKAINTKILIGILAALTAIAGLLVHIHDADARNAAAAEKSAAILKQQQDAAQAQKDTDAAFWKGVDEKRKKSHSYNAGGDKALAGPQP
jgi:uncharacterized protein YxeA